jgi:hypothetical protein
VTILVRGPLGRKPLAVPVVLEADDLPAERIPMSAFAVVELFTSEGCSSCPPADDVLRELATRDEHIIALGFHVDYWDHLGWAEPYGSPQWTQRQTDYAHALGLRGLYTPQVVVNGTAECVGSRGRDVRKAVDAALRRPGVEVRASVARVPGGVIITGTADADHLNLVAVLVQGHGRSRVLRGENAGRTLEHVDIVRELRVGRSGTPISLLAEGNDLSVVVLAQNPVTKAILGATRLALGSSGVASGVDGDSADDGGCHRAG